MKYTQKHPLLAGTFLLTSAGLFARFIGFFYRIYLSRVYGAESVGLYQLITPILTLSFSLTVSGCQTAISKNIAASEQKDIVSPLITFLSALCIPLLLSLVITFLLLQFPEYIALHILKEPRCAPLLTAIAFSVPLSTLHDCANGYFYGIRQNKLPALTQVIEQLTRVGFVLLATTYVLNTGALPSISLAAAGLTIAEVPAVIISLTAIAKHYRHAGQRLPKLPFSRIRDEITSIYYTAFPLACNRITSTLLMSIETIALPLSLQRYGLDSKQALELYGVLTGMVLPFLFFPNAAAASASVVLVPEISSRYKQGDTKRITAMLQKVSRLCLLLGFSMTLFLLLAGDYIGNIIFRNAMAGYFLTALSFLCPFMYLNTTLSGILQGINKASAMFFVNIVCMSLRLLCVFFLIPIVGMQGFLWVLLATHLLTTVFYLWILWDELHKHLPSSGN